MTQPTTATARVITPELHARMDQLSKEREAHRIEPGWWMRTINDDDTRTWVYVSVTAECVHIETGRKTVRWACLNPDEPGTVVTCAAHRGELVACITLVQARTLGLTNPRQTGTPNHD